MIISFRHDKQRSHHRRKLLGIFFVSAVVIFLARAPISNMLGGVLASAGGPLWMIEDVVAERVHDVKTIFTSKIALQKENATLRDALDAVAIESLSRDMLRAENDTLKTKLGRSPERSLLLGRVLSSPAASPYDTLLIDVGERYGVSVGMEVFTDGDFVIGVITRTWKESSLVTLYSAPGSEVFATIGTSSIPAIAHGTGGGNFRIVLPKGLSIAVGDMVEMPALSPTYVGVVGGVARSEQSSLQTIFTKLPINIYQLKWVYVLFSSESTTVPPIESNPSES